jgi:hypothetical protein
VLNSCVSIGQPKSVPTVSTKWKSPTDHDQSPPDQDEPDTPAGEPTNPPGSTAPKGVDEGIAVGKLSIFTEPVTTTLPVITTVPVIPIVCGVKKSTLHGGNEPYPHGIPPPVNGVPSAIEVNVAGILGVAGGVFVSVGVTVGVFVGVAVGEFVPVGEFVAVGVLVYVAVGAGVKVIVAVGAT